MLKKLKFMSSLALIASGAVAQPTPDTPAAPSPAVTAGGAPVKAFPVRDYVRFPEYGAPLLSPNSKYLAVLVPINERINLAVIDLEARKSTVLTSITRFDVLQPRWVGNERLVFSMGQQNSPTGPGQYDGGGLFMVSRDGKESRALAPTVREMRNAHQNVGRGMRLLTALPDNDREVLVASNQRSADSADVYRLDVTTGKTTLLTATRPERADDWVLDRSFVPRVTVASVKNELERIVWYRESEAAPWVELTRIKDRETGETSEQFIPLAFDNDNQTLLVASNRGRDTMAIFKYDPREKKFGEMVAGHPRFDMGADAAGHNVPGLIISSRSREVLGYSVAAEKEQDIWTNEGYARLQAMLDKALPDRVNRVRRSEQQGGKALITSYSDRSAPEFFLLDEGSRQMENIATSMSWLTKDHLVEMRPFNLRTRDGLEIPSYYFLPKNRKDGERLPTVVHIHGGPHVRADHWGPLWTGGTGVVEAQILASRGYAVVLPNYRITPGFGAKVYSKGFGTVGREMSEDHEDAAKWAIDQGIADPQRICISGSSYGGYATLRALAKTPELFKCGMAGLSVSDMELQISSTAGDTVYNTAGVKYWKRLLGEDKAPGSARAVSPVYQADRIKSPLFIWAGADDIRTPIEQTNRMVDALRTAGQKPEVMIKAEEGHGYGRTDNRVDLYEKMLDFLDRQIGSKSLQ